LFIFILCWLDFYFWTGFKLSLCFQLRKKVILQFPTMVNHHVWKFLYFLQTFWADERLIVCNWVASMGQQVNRTQLFEGNLLIPSWLGHCRSCHSRSAMPDLSWVVQFADFPKQAENEDNRMPFLPWVIIQYWKNWKLEMCIGRQLHRFTSHTRQLQESPNHIPPKVWGMSIAIFVSQRMQQQR